MRPKTINAKHQLNGDPEYAKDILARLRKQGKTAVEVSHLTGIHVRSIYRIQSTGFVKFPMQHILECLAGLRNG